MKKNIKRIILGLLVASLLMGTAFGSGIQEKIEVLINSVNLSVNGKSIGTIGESYKLDNGEEVPYSILYKGTTYLPIRKVAEALEKEVAWDGSTSTAKINDKIEEKIIIEDKNPVADKKETISQKNAVKSAKSYLEYTAFSKTGLIKQLKFEKYSEEDATYAVNRLDIDWKEEAYKSAKNYLEYTSFSRDGLIKQLEFEGFTNEEAVYAVDKLEY